MARSDSREGRPGTKAKQTANTSQNVSNKRLEGLWCSETPLASARDLVVHPGRPLESLGKDSQGSSRGSAVAKEHLL